MSPALNLVKEFFASIPGFSDTFLESIMPELKIECYITLQSDGLHISSPFNEIVIPIKLTAQMAKLMTSGHNFSYDSANEILIDESERHFAFLKKLDEIREQGHWPKQGVEL